MQTTSAAFVNYYAPARSVYALVPTSAGSSTHDGQGRPGHSGGNSQWRGPQSVAAKPARSFDRPWLSVELPAPSAKPDAGEEPDRWDGLYC